MNTGLCSVTFRELSPEEIIDQVKKAKLNYIEWGGDIHVPPGDIKRATAIGKRCKEQGICVSYGSYFKFFDDQDFEPIRKTAKALGAKDIRVWADHRHSDEFSKEDKRKLVSHAQKIARILEEDEMTLNFELHRHTLTDTTKSALELMQAIDRENVYVYWQPQQKQSEEEKKDSIRTLLPFISKIHVFYWDQNSNRYELEEGIDYWKEYISLLGKDHDYLLEFVKNDSMKQMHKDANLLNQLIKE